MMYLHLDMWAMTHIWVKWPTVYVCFGCNTCNHVCTIAEGPTKKIILISNSTEAQYTLKRISEQVK